MSLSNSGNNNASIKSTLPLIIGTTTVGQDLSLTSSGVNDITLTNALASIIGTTTIGRNFTINSTGNITQAFPITATGGVCTFLVSSPSKSILLPENNDFGANTPVFGSGANIINLNLKNISSTPMMPDVTALTNLHFLEVNFPNGTVALSNLNMNGTAILEGNNVTGNLNVHGLQLGSNFCNLFGFVNGMAGQAAIDQVVLLNTITAGTHFFDGIYMFGVTPIPPTPTPSLPAIAQPTKIAIDNTLYVTNNFWESTKVRDLLVNYYDILALQGKDSSNTSTCASYGADIEVCY